MENYQLRYPLHEYYDQTKETTLRSAVPSAKLVSILPITDNMHFVPAGELQGNIRSVNPLDFTRIFTLKLSIHTNNAIITNGKLRQ